MTTEELRRAVRGPVLEPGDKGYDAARRIWNVRFEERPAIIVQATEVQDVVAAVEFARSRGLPPAVKGGGHSYAGKSVREGGLLIDLSRMNQVRVDPETETARVGAGAILHAFDSEAQEHGLATTTGACSQVGVGGLTLGGGTGWLVRRLGLTIDNVVSADVVTADGRIVHASEDEHPDLFWGLRGGGGNFGVVTSFKFRLHEVGPEVVAGQIVHRLEEAERTLRFYRGFMDDAADEIQCYAFFLRVPPVPPFPEAFHGRVVLDLVVCHSGDPADGEAALRPLREFGDSILDTVETIPYVALQQAFDDGLPAGERYCSRARYMNDLSDEAIETVLQHVGDLPGAFTVVYVEPLGGAVRRVDPAETAFPHRLASCGFHILAGWSDPDEDDRLVGWTEKFHRAMAPHSTGGVYVNLLGAREEGRVDAAYGDNYGRLARLKAEWDPENLFRVNHNIEPAG